MRYILNCPICKKQKKTYSKSFYCCGNRMPSEKYAINLLKNHSPESLKPTATVVESVDPTKIGDSRGSILATEKPLENSKENSKEVVTAEEGVLSPLASSPTVKKEFIEEKELEIKEEEVKKEIDPSTYDHQCGTCGSYFNDDIFQKNNKHCPKCNEDYN